MKEKHSLSVIVVNYNTCSWLTGCLASLERWAPNAECWVVDNASSDGGISEAIKKFPKIHWILNQENRGFAAANNQALMQATGKWIWLLNPDTELHGPIAPWLEELSGWPAAGIIGSRLIYPDGRIQLSWGRTPHLFTEAMQRNYWNFLERDVNGGQKTLRRLAGKPRRVGWVLGASLLIRRETFEAIGPMDERFHMYFEEVDWCLRARACRWEVLFHPGLTVTHWKGKAASQNPEGMLLAYRKSQLLFYQKHHGVWAASLLKGYLHLKFRNHPLRKQLFESLREIP